MRQPSITKIRLKITYLKFHSNFPGANELRTLLAKSHCLTYPACDTTKLRTLWSPLFLRTAAAAIYPRSTSARDVATFPRHTWRVPIPSIVPENRLNKGRNEHPRVFPKWQLLCTHFRIGFHELYDNLAVGVLIQISLSFGWNKRVSQMRGGGDYFLLLNAFILYRVNHCSSMVPCYKVKYIDIRTHLYTFININHT